MRQPMPIFDSHLHIIDSHFPLVPNQGFLPETFTVADYRERTRNLDIVGGAVVSGSYQAFDQSYLLAALEELGPGFVGVTQLPASTSDAELRALDRAGVCGVRFNLRRGGSETVDNLDYFARRVYDLLGWHCELYVDSSHLAELEPIIRHLPRVCIDHLGLSRIGIKELLRLVEQGIYVKATGFGRVDFNISEMLREIVEVNAGALVFGTDLPSTRSPRPFQDTDVDLVIDALGEDLAKKVFWYNARDLYRLS